MSHWIWYLRWQACRTLVYAGFLIAPDGAAKRVFTSALVDASNHIMTVLREHGLIRPKAPALPVEGEGE